jgi:serine/threonine protein kinase/cytochrome c-type biogenesis protein CcmH/NrfG
MMQRIGKYEILERVGRGGMGSVFRAYDPMLDRAVALKVISSDSDATEELRARFFREAQACARLNHPNIVTVHDLGEADGQLFIVMELLEGQELRQIIADRKIADLEDKLSIIAQICDGLDFAHQKGIVHRDVKPSNILVLRNGQVKILDFGIAHIEGTGTGLTRAGVIMGTIRYMAPEQVRGRADQRADIFSLGAVCYELITYGPAFAGEDPMEILEQLRTQDPPRLVDVDPGVPPELSAVIERALQKDPAQRYSGIGQMRLDLDEVRRRLTQDAARLHGEVQARLGELRDLEAACAARLGASLTESTASVLTEPVRSAAIAAVHREIVGRIDRVRDLLARADSLQPVYDRGLEALQRGDWDTAAAELAQVVQSLPEHTRAVESLEVVRRELEAQQQQREVLATQFRGAQDAYDAGEYERCVGVMGQMAGAAPSPCMPPGFDELRRRAEEALSKEREQDRLEALRQSRAAAEEVLARCQQARSAAKSADAKRDAAAFWNAAERRLAEGQTALAGEDHARAGEHFSEASGLYERAETVAREARTASAARRVDDLLAEAERLVRAGRFTECLSRIQEIDRLVPGHSAVGELRARAEAGLNRAGVAEPLTAPRPRDAAAPRNASLQDHTMDAAPAIVLADAHASGQAGVPAASSTQTSIHLPSSATVESRGGRSAVLPEAPASVDETAGPEPMRDGTASTAVPSRSPATRTPLLVGIAAVVIVVVGVGAYLLMRPGAPPEKAPLREAPARVEKAPATAPTDGAKALIEQARQVAAANPAEAERLLRQAIEANAKSVQAFFQLGLLYARQREYTKAIDAYWKAADLDPNFPDAAFNLAYVYATTSEYQKAAEMYARVAALAPPYLDEALFNLAIVQEKLGKRPEAIQSLERAIQINPNNKPAERFLASLKRKR